METTVDTTRQSLHQPHDKDAAPVSPFAQEWVTITKEEHIALVHRASYWEAQHALVKQKCSKLEEEGLRKDAKIKDLQNRLFGKKSEKKGLISSVTENKGDATLFYLLYINYL